MVTATQSTASRPVVAQSGMILPATIDQQTDMNLMETACIVYHRCNEYRVAYDTLNRVKDAVRDSGAVVTLYVDAKGEQAARVLWPFSLTLTKDNNLTCRAYCTLRREVRSFRLDRFIASHDLTTPADMEPADDEPHQDFEDTIAGRNYR